MDQSQPKNISPYIAWSLVALFAGLCAFSNWYYYDQVSTAYDSIPTFYGTDVHKKAATTTGTTTTPATTSATADWKTYTNSTHKYSIKYPTTWAYREFSGTGTGVGFRLSTTASDPSNEFINIGYNTRATNDATLSFEDYVKVAAIHDIQGYNKLLTMDKVTTTNGVIGYKTTWQVTALNGTTETSEPITYFPSPDGSLKGTVQVSLLKASMLNDYNTMLSTFQFTK